MALIPINILQIQMELQKIIGDYRGHFRLEKHQITIELRHKFDGHLLRTVLQNGALPPSFANIFDDVSDLYSFVDRKLEESAAVIGNTLVLRVVIFKKREISIEMTTVEVEGNKKMADKLDKLEQKTDKLAQDLASLIPTFKKEIIRATASHFNQEIKKLQSRIAKLEKQLQKKETNGNQYPNKGQQVPRKQLVAQRIARMSAPMTTDYFKSYEFEVDPRSHYLEQYLIDRSKITRKVEDQEIYMLSSSNPISRQGMVEIKMRVNKITEGLIWIGLLCQSKKGEQYIGEQQGIIQLCLEGNRALVDGKIVNLPFKEFKSGETVEMRVCLEDRQLSFSKNEEDQPFYELQIPASMLCQPIYPYIQMINQGDSVSFFD